MKSLPQTKLARFVKDVSAHFSGDARLYEMSPRVEYKRGATTAFVVVSAAVVPFSGPETYIFPCTSEGEVLDWTELDGSFQGGLDHVKALNDAGYEVQA